MVQTEGAGFATAQIHAGQLPGEHGARVPPIHLSAGFVFDDLDFGRDRFADPDDGFSYTRIGNPTVAALERKIAALEGGIQAIAVGSGQAATTVALLGILAAGDHVVASRSIYEGTRGLLRDNLARLGIDVTFVEEPSVVGAWQAAVRPSTRAFFAETIPNPKNDVTDLRAVAAVADAAGVPFVVDSTLTTPYLLRPLDHGAAVVVHSASKFLAGHGAALGGLVVFGDRFDWSVLPHLAAPVTALGGRSYVDVHGRAAAAAFARHAIAARFGPTLSPLHAFLVQQGVETLSLRVDRHSANALQLATWLERQPQVAHVDYAGLSSHPQHAVAARYLRRGFGSVFTIEVHGGVAGARAFLDALALTSQMSHLGDVRTLALHPASTSHAQLSVDEREALGIRDGHVRLSIGIEDAADIAADLDRGLAAVDRLLAHTRLGAA